MSNHRTACPTFPRPGAGRHREPRVLAPLTLLFVLTGRTSR